VSLNGGAGRHHAAQTDLIDGSYQFRAVVTDAAATAPPPVPSRSRSTLPIRRRHAAFVGLADTGSPARRR